MQDINDLTKPNSVHRAVGVAVVILDDLENTRSLPLPRLGTWMRAAKLRDAQRVAEFRLHRTGETHKIALRRPDPVERPLTDYQTAAHRKYPRIRIMTQEGSRNLYTTYARFTIET